VTDGYGYYSFMPASLNPGESYYVYFRNNAPPNIGYSQLLYSWTSFPITSYTAGDTVHGGSFNLDDIYAEWPGLTTIDSLALPAVFTWSGRSGQVSDRYRWVLSDQSVNIVCTADVDKATSFILHSSKFDSCELSYNTQYTWRVFVLDGTGAFGMSRQNGTVIFVQGSAIPATPTAPPPGGGLPPVVNGDFELGPGVGWVEASGTGRELVVQSSSPPPHSGQWLATLGGEMYDYIEQAFTLPATGPIYLHFSVQIRSNATSCYYKNAVRIMFNSAEVLKYTLCQPNSTSDWVPISLNLSGYTGQTVTVRFYVTNLSELGYFYLEDFYFSNSP
jgi:hypothetical protein